MSIQYHSHTQYNASYVNMAKNREREKMCNEIEIITIIAATVECRPSIIIVIIILLFWLHDTWWEPRVRSCILYTFVCTVVICSISFLLFFGEKKNPFRFPRIIHFNSLAAYCSSPGEIYSIWWGPFDLGLQFPIQWIELNRHNWLRWM